MKGAALIALLAGSAGLWAWAHLSPKPVESIPDHLPGRYRLYRYEPPQEGEHTNPFLGQEVEFLFEADGAYRITIRLQGNREMFRREGMAGGDAGRLVLHQVSENRTPADLEIAYRLHRAQDPEGEYLLLTAEEDGHELYLRPLASE